ncbi:MAG: oxidoreductase [Gammaproteobacteria bacterium HGW-Gammaproteobacteria-8]|nr:MAG: oxidoreductase [Gammaproteobacteria bacterium HGW-Gammaproteobacteria-8]
MMSLGMFVFSLRTVPFQERQRQTTWRHPAAERLGKRPTRQFVGLGDDTITLGGELKPEVTGGAETLDLLRVMADSGEAFALIDGDGNVRGMYIMESLQETGGDLLADGTARSIDFTLVLQRSDDEGTSRRATS